MLGKKRIVELSETKLQCEELRGEIFFNSWKTAKIRLSPTKNPKNDEKWVLE